MLVQHHTSIFILPAGTPPIVTSAIDASTIGHQIFCITNHNTYRKIPQDLRDFVAANATASRSYFRSELFTAKYLTNSKWVIKINQTSWTWNRLKVLLHFVYIPDKCGERHRASIPSAVTNTFNQVVHAYRDHRHCNTKVVPGDINMK
jgi:hypothetical protein